MAGPHGLGRVVANLCALLAPIQWLDAGINVQHPRPLQGLVYRMHQARTHPCRAGCFVHALQRPAQRIFADHLGHAQRLRGHRVAAQRGDVRVAPMPGQQPEHQRAQYVAFVRRVAAAVGQRAIRHPALEDASSGQKLREEHQLAMRRGRRTFVPAHVHAPAQRIHDLRLGRLLARASARRQRLASCFTHWVSVPRLR